jgi:outer membrane protein insertion porin family
MFVGRGWDPSSGYRYLWDNTLQFKFPIVPNILAFDLFLDGVGAWVATRGQFDSSDALFNMNINDWRFSLGAGFRFANPQFPIGIYLVKKFQWDLNGEINWNPEPDLTEFKKWGMDLVIAFNMNIY